jgi:hypothetical protein
VVSVQNVIRKVLAADEETTEKIEVVKNNQPSTNAFLFFNAGEEIPFNNITEYVKTNKSKVLINLENGNLSWEKAVLKTNEYNTGEPESEDNSLLYVVSLNRDGTLAGNEVIKDMKNNDRNNNNLKNYDAILNKIRSMLFVDNKLNFSLNTQTIKRSYADRDLISIIKTGVINESLKVNDFDNYYGIGTHRMRTMPSTNIPGVTREPVLLGARYEIPSSADNFDGKNKPFLGTKDQIEYLKKIDPVEGVSTIKEEKSDAQLNKDIGMKDKKPGNKSKFVPVSEQEKVTEEQVTDQYRSAGSDKGSTIKEFNEDDPYANYYTGDNSVMQDLVRRQHKKMKIRKNAQFTSTQPTPSTPSTSSTSTSKSPSIPISQDPKKNVEHSNLLKDIAKKQEDVNKQLESINQAISASSATVENVLATYLFNKL